MKEPCPVLRYEKELSSQKRFATLLHPTRGMTQPTAALIEVKAKAQPATCMAITTRRRENPLRLSERQPGGGSLGRVPVMGHSFYLLRAFR